MRLRLNFTLDDSGHLVAMPSGGLWALTALQFASAGVVVSAKACNPVVLGWDTYGRVASLSGGKQAHDGWVIAPWTAGDLGSLARDLDANRLEKRGTSGGVRRDAVDVRTALRGLGYVHQYGRPLSRTEVPTLAEVTGKVMAALGANRYRVGRPIDRTYVERIARRDYVDVDPWPFAALVDS